MIVYHMEPDIFSGGVLLISNRLTYAPLHTHDYFEFLLAKNGKSLHCINGITEIVENGQLSFIRDTDRHFYQDYYDSSFGYCNLHVSRPFLNKILSDTDTDFSWLFEGDISPKITLDPRDYELIVRRLEAFAAMEKGSEKAMLYDIIIRELLFLFSAKRHEKPDIIPMWFNRLISEIRKPEVFSEGLSRVIEISGYSREYINRSFRKYIDMTPTAYINNLRLDYAAKLISEGDCNMLRASQLAGFSHYGYFCTLFKKRFGCMPKEFKQI
ncbi:MAG: helix-turn-helix domain-containing protein [Clostridia bacterium]|nr:helix-turn-helix domain-containing protein [Clostridia bacterium]